MTQPAPRTVRFLLHHPSQNQGFREWLGSPSSAQTVAPPTKEEPIRKAAPKQAKKSSRAKAPQQGQQVGLFEELLEATPALTLLWIPPGRFWMGSPATEPEHRDSEGPQHLVQLQGFFMSQTSITQAQWREVAGWKEGPGEQWGRELKLDPSRFQSNNDQHPVENVTWWEAMEFCHRLSKRTDRIYTLPSEAQWEYACRAGTITPFHFGDTISPELANYNGTHAYGDGPKGINREQTTPVGMFPANAWGLQDMHGNVWEWCLDEWHESYEGAPTDGRVWAEHVEGEKGKEREQTRLVRGGSWLNYPRECRSAFRFHFRPDFAFLSVGFRVVCLPHGPSLNP
ncbi:MAG: hypothetical protein RLZZ206_154 [Cyanobacteriota bacterium]|jgi:formylglycine-generating enzyme required for sulfatase activity